MASWLVAKFPGGEMTGSLIDNLILRGFVSEAGLKFQPRMKFAM